MGKEEQALRLMFEMLSNRRNRTWSQTHEKVMLRYVELCVEKKNNRFAKEGLHQYRNISLQQAPGSLETVIEYMLKLAINKANDASALCTNKTVEDVEDLENDKSPEAVLLETVTSDKDKERTEREYLVPWLKFLWESFRTVLEILRNNSKMEHVYHETAHRAFKFCKEYQRATEFRRLCEILRNHLANAQKYAKEKEPAITMDSMELHLATRFDQLKVASHLRIWHEGFRTIEDIHFIMTISNKRPSSQLMATYYQKLTQLFLVSENYLFHAYAYKAFYYLSREKNKSLTKDQIKIMSSSVLLAAMSIPLQDAKAGTTFAEEGMQKEKNRRMAQLLGFDINPKRKSILEELLNRGILDAVIPEVKDLYLLLEEEFTPLDLVQRAIPLLQTLSGQKKLQSYVKPLETLLVIRLLSQLTKIYYSVRLDYFKELLKDLGTPFLEIEKSIIKAVKARQVSKLGVQIDHRAGCIRFSEDVMEEDRTRTLLTEMTRGLQGINSELEPIESKTQREEERSVLARTVLGEISRKHELILARKTEIEHRKEEFERMEADKALLEQQKREKLEAERQRAEQARLDKQRELREQEKEQALRDEERLFEIQREMVAEGIDIKGSDINAMTKEQRENLIEETRKKAKKASIQTERKLNAASKKLDATVRALREVERPLLEEAMENEIQDQEKAFKAAWQEELKSGEDNHRLALETKARFAALQGYRASYEEPLLRVWEEECERQREKVILKIQLQQRIAKLERARKRKKEADMRRIREEEKRKQAEEAARRKKEEEERREQQRLEEEERRQKEEENRKVEQEGASQKWRSHSSRQEEDSFDRRRMDEGKRDFASRDRDSGRDSRDFRHRDFRDGDRGRDYGRDRDRGFDRDMRRDRDHAGGRDREPPAFGSARFQDRDAPSGEREERGNWRRGGPPPERRDGPRNMSRGGGSRYDDGKWTKRDAPDENRDPRDSRDSRDPRDPRDPRDRSGRSSNFDRERGGQADNVDNWRRK